MNKLFSLALIFVGVSFLGASTESCYDSERCLPPAESDNHLFPRCKSFFGSADFLYWTMKEGGLDYVIQDCCLGEVSKLPFGTLKKSSFKAKPGFRVSVGYYNAPRYWEVAGEYTYYKTNGCDATLGSRDCLLSPTQNVFFFKDNLDVASAENDFKYQLGDFFVARVFDPNPHLRMRFLAGIGGAFLDHSFKACYSEDSFYANYQNDWQYKAGGLRLGLTADWFWRWGLYLTGKATLGGFIGSYKNTYCQITDDNAINNFQNGFLCSKDTRFAEHIQLLIGPSWQNVSRCFYYSVLVGYEMNGWFNLQESFRTVVTPSSRAVLWNTSALAMHGLTIRLNGGF
jgi:hypothetical protein